jgi:hypothetical protein
LAELAELADDSQVQPPFIVVEIEMAKVDRGLVLVLTSTQRVPLVGDEMERKRGRRPNVSGRGKIYS